jgi:small subunit ribosomal protein S7
VNNLMLDGRKNTAFKVFYDAMDSIAEKETEETSLKVFEKSLENIMPHVEVRSRRIGGATFQIPHPVREDRRVSLGMKWMIGAARKRNEKTMEQKLAGEILAGYKEEGASYKKKQDTHRMAEANKAFSHFRF